MRFPFAAAFAFAAFFACSVQPAASARVELTPMEPISRGISPRGAEALYAAIKEKCSRDAVFRPYYDGFKELSKHRILLAGCVGASSGRTVWAIYNGETPILIARDDIEKFFRIVYKIETVLMPMKP